MKLKDLCTAEAADQGIDIELFHPSSGVPIGIIINMKGSDSQAYLDADRKIKNRQLEHSKRKRDFTAGMEPEAIEAGLIERMKACFNSWKEKKGDGTFKDTVSFDEGVELASNKEEFGKIIANRGFFWIRQQVQEGMDKVANFLPKPKSGSAPAPSSPTNMTGQEKTE